MTPKQKFLISLVIISFTFLQFRSIRLLLKTESYSSNYLLREDKIKKYTDLTSIRRWGCQQTESPLIFVHIPKAGGGSIRTRLAAAAENYTRSSKDWRRSNYDNHFYPIRRHDNVNGTVYYERGKFCNSKNKHFRLSPLMRYKKKVFEGSTECHATTPVGRLISCPGFWWPKDGNCEGCYLTSSTCNTVYTGHNLLGNEMHWLPVPYLEDWWKREWAPFFTSSFSSTIERQIHSLSPDTETTVWCPQFNQTRKVWSRSSTSKRDPEHFKCSKQLSESVDREFQLSWKEVASEKYKNYAPLYASLPLHRTVMLRDTDSWLLSCFFWHSHYEDYKCDDYIAASYHDKQTLKYEEAGWAYQRALSYLMYLCGEDCVNRYEVGSISLEEIEQQAEANLRHSFSVVGLLSDTNDYFDMLTTRLQYVNMSKNPHILPSSHSSVPRPKKLKEEYTRCKYQYEKNETFKALFRQQLPHLQILDRLYNVGVKVNHFQRQELEECRRH